jgi:Entericidin EcnA/B family
MFARKPPIAFRLCDGYSCFTQQRVWSAIEERRQGGRTDADHDGRLPFIHGAFRSALAARGVVSESAAALFRRILEFGQRLQGLPGRVRQPHLLIDDLKAAERYSDEMGSHAEKAPLRQDDVGDPISWADDQIVNRSDLVLVLVVVAGAGEDISKGGHAIRNSAEQAK